MSAHGASYRALAQLRRAGPRFCSHILHCNLPTPPLFALKVQIPHTQVECLFSVLQHRCFSLIPYAGLDKPNTAKESLSLRTPHLPSGRLLARLRSCLHNPNLGISVALRCKSLFTFPIRRNASCLVDIGGCRLRNWGCEFSVGSKQY